MIRVKFVSCFSTLKTKVYELIVIGCVCVVMQLGYDFFFLFMFIDFKN